MLFIIVSPNKVVLTAAKTWKERNGNNTHDSRLFKSIMKCSNMESMPRISRILLSAWRLPTTVSEHITNLWLTIYIFPAYLTGNKVRRLYR